MSLIGYNGLYSGVDEGKVPSAFYISTIDRRELFITLLTPASFRSVFDVASNLYIQVVHIFTPKLDIYNVSDVANLIRYLNKYGKMVKFYYPENVETNYYMNMLMSMQSFTRRNMSGSIDNEILISYEDSKTFDNAFNLRTIVDGKIRIISMGMNLDEIEHYADSNIVHEIHIPYYSTKYNKGASASFSDLLHTPKLRDKVWDKLVINAFHNTTELYDARHMKIKIGEVIRHDICQTLQS